MALDIREVKLSIVKHLLASEVLPDGSTRKLTYVRDFARNREYFHVEGNRVGDGAFTYIDDTIDEAVKTYNEA